MTGMLAGAPRSAARRGHRAAVDSVCARRIRTYRSHHRHGDLTDPTSAVAVASPCPRLAGDRLSGPLGRRLDDRYHYFRQVLAGGKEPIEAVVVGPGGTWALTLRAEPRAATASATGTGIAGAVAPSRGSRGTPSRVNAARLAGHRLEMYLERATLPSA